MKKLLTLFLVLAIILSLVSCTSDSNDNRQPKDTPTPSDEPLQFDNLNAPVAWVNWSEHSDLVTKSLNFEKMSVSSVQHLPIFKCESVNDLEGFKDQFKDILSLSSSYDEVPSFEEISTEFGKNFFEDSTLFLVYVTANSGSFRFALDSVCIDEGIFRADIIQTNFPESVTENMAGWLIAIPVAKDQLQDVKNYDAVMQVSEKQPVAYENASEAWYVNSYADRAEKDYILSEEDASILEKRLSSEGWENALTDCASDVWLKSSDGRKIVYHSDCGTFNDTARGQSLSLDEIEQENFNNMLRKYCKLGFIEYDLDLKNTIDGISKKRAEEISLEECKTDYDYIETEFDSDKQQWRIEFWENNAKLPAQTIWVDAEGNVVNIWWAE